MDRKEDRLKVQTHLNVNMVVEAGAGTGKTTLLIRRLCLAVLVQQVPVEKLVALTFTEKAAAEIKTLLIQALHQTVDFCKNPPADREEALVKQEPTLWELLREYFKVPVEDLQSRAQAALERLDRASVGTIHSFCADILKTFPLEAGLSPQAEIDSGEKANRLFEARWNAFLDKELGVNAPRAVLWKRVLPEISLADLKIFAQELCSGKIEEYDYFAHRKLLINVCEEKIRQATLWSQCFLPAGTRPRNSEKALIWAKQSLERTILFLKGETVPPAPEDLPPAFPATLSKGWEEQTFEEARALAAFALKVTPEKQQLFLDALELVQAVTQPIRADYAREGILSFDDLIVKTRDLLRTNGYVRRLLKEKFDVFFIDEFQDTDPVQGEIFLFLSEEKTQCASRWQDVRLAPGKIIVVGDPKQSIYRFRGADITAYELFTDLIIQQHGEKCFLQQNHRSAPDIVASANEICSRAMVQEAAFQPQYVPIFPAKEISGPSVEWLFVRPADEGAAADDYRHNQAERIADWISTHVGRMTLQDGHKLTYQDITLLTRASTTAGPYIDALRRRNIPFNVETDKDFFRKQEINDFLNFLRVIADPNDKIALAGVLRSPLGGLTDEELYQVQKRGELSLYVSSDNEAVKTCYEEIKKFAQKAGRMDIKSLLESILAESFLPEACAAAYEGERTLASLHRLVRIAQTKVEQTPANLGQFVAGIKEELTAHPERLGAGVAEDAANAVSVMTVHKSKGLGFPVVIFADLSKKDNTSSADPVRHAFSWQYNMHGLRAGKICDINLAFLEEEQRKHSRCEEVRILYVALTRAKEHLLLVADGRKGVEKAAAWFAAAGLLPDGKSVQLTNDALTVPVTYADFEAPEHFIYRPVLAPLVQADAHAFMQWRQQYDLRRTRYEQLKQTALLAPSQRVLHEDVIDPRQQEGMAIGTLCHEVLEQLLLSKTLDVGAILCQVAQKNGLEKYIPAATAILNPFVASDIYRELAGCHLLASEMPFTLAEEKGGTVSGVIDGVFQTQRGTYWVVDYKTDQIPAEGIEALSQKYAPQLEVYKRAAQQLFPGKEVRCSAVFLRAFAVKDL